MYIPDVMRYEHMEFRRCGASGLKLPILSLGLWHNFGAITPFAQQQVLLRTAFDQGITHFDLANNYGPPYGEAERNFGRHMQCDWKTHRHELVISTKAGYDMWPGPYGDHGSRKYLLTSLDQSLKRMNLEHVDIFYHHRPDPETPLEETMGALDSAVRQGKALYIGLSNYKARETAAAISILRDLGTPCLIHQPSYSMMNRWVETDGLLDILRNEQIGMIAFAPMQNGLLTSRYLHEIPKDSRAGHDPRYLKPDAITEAKRAVIQALHEIAESRGQTLAQMALQWTLRDIVVTSALIGASKPEQIVENCQALRAPYMTESELARIDEILRQEHSQ